MDGLQAALEAKASEFADVVKAGRTHLMDAVPVTLGQEFGGYAAQVRLGIERVEGTLRPGRPDPARRHRHRHRPQHPPRVRRQGAREARGRHRPGDLASRSTRFEAQGNRDALVELSGALKVYAVSLNKIANDLALMGSGPRAGLAELRLPELQKGSSIMPGKVNPVIPEVVIQVAAQVIGNDAAITVAGSQGQFELNVRVPLIARNLLDSIKLLASASRLLNEKCVAGLEANEEMTDAPRRGDAGDGDRAQPPHRLRPRRRASSRRPPSRAARCARSPRAGGRRADPRAGARPPPHGAAARVAAAQRRSTVSQPRTRSRLSTIARSRRPRPQLT